MTKGAFDLRPLNVGAEIIGLRPGQEEDPALRLELYDAWLKYGVLLFHEVESVDHHLALSRCFGELELHPYPEIRWKENPLLVQIGGASRGPAYYFDDDCEPTINRLAWHRDTAYTPDVCTGAMLRMLEVPRTDGETMLADTAAAYDDLPDAVKARLEGLEYKATLRLSAMAQTRPGGFWKKVRRATSEEDPMGGLSDDDEMGAQRYPSVVHPAVLTHPESGRKCIFLSPTYVDQFLGLQQDESDELLEYLTHHMLQAQYVYTHHWSPNDAILWDNRRFMHAARGCRIGEARRGLRTTLAGAIRTGRFFDPNVEGDDLPVFAD